jgi:DNA-directed RNA polymerase III subunit RPC6
MRDLRIVPSDYSSTLPFTLQSFPRKIPKRNIPEEIYVPNPIYAPSHTSKLPGPAAILSYFEKHDICKIKLGVEHIIQIMSMLVYEGKVEIIKPIRKMHEEGWNSDLEENGGAADEDEAAKMRAERQKVGKKRPRPEDSASGSDDDSDDGSDSGGERDRKRRKKDKEREKAKDRKRKEKEKEKDKKQRKKMAKLKKELKKTRKLEKERKRKEKEKERKRKRKEREKKVCLLESNRSSEYCAYNLSSAIAVEIQDQDGRVRRRDGRQRQ